MAVKVWDGVEQFSEIEFGLMFTLPKPFPKIELPPLQPLNPLATSSAAAQPTPKASRTKKTGRTLTVLTKPDTELRSERYIRFRLPATGFSLSRVKEHKQHNCARFTGPRFPAGRGVREGDSSEIGRAHV